MNNLSLASERYRCFAELSKEFTEVNIYHTNGISVGKGGVSDIFLFTPTGDVYRFYGTCPQYTLGEAVPNTILTKVSWVQSGFCIYGSVFSDAAEVAKWTVVDSLELGGCNSFMTRGVSRELIGQLGILDARQYL